MRNRDHALIRRLIEPSDCTDMSPRRSRIYRPPSYVSRCAANWIFTREHTSRRRKSVNTAGFNISPAAAEWKLKFSPRVARTLRWARVCKPPVRGSFVPALSWFSSFFIPPFFLPIPPSALFRRTFWSLSPFPLSLNSLSHFIVYGERPDSSRCHIAAIWRGSLYLCNVNWQLIGR